MWIQLKIGLKWFVGLGRKFLRVAPAPSLALVFLAVFSQFSLLFAFLVPVKIIMLIGANRVPSYFPSFLVAIEHHKLIVLLTIAAIVAYALHALSDWAAGAVARRGSQRVLAAARKMLLMHNQAAVAEKAYRSYFILLASTLFVIIGLGALLVFSPLAASIIMGFSLIVMMLFAVAQLMPGTLSDAVNKNAGSLIQLSTGLGFMLLFGALVANFLTRDNQSVIGAVLGLILGRQILNKLSSATRDLIKLFQDRPRLDAMFMHRAVLDQLPDRGDSFWRLLMPEKRLPWIEKVLQDILGNQHKQVLRVNWWAARNGIFELLCDRADAPPVFVKVYEAKGKLMAAHEAALLEINLDGLPSLHWLGSRDFDEFVIHALAPNGPIQPVKGDIRGAQLRVLQQLRPVRLPETLVDSVARSRPMLWDRLSQVQVERLRICVDGELDNRILELIARLDTIKDLLRSMPLVIVNPHRDRSNMLDTGLPAPQLLSWEQWSLEPLGSDLLLPGMEPDLAVLIGVAEELGQGDRGDLAQMRGVLAALAFELDRCCARQLYSRALRIAPRLLDSLQRVQGTTTGSTSKDSV